MGDPVSGISTTSPVELTRTDGPGGAQTAKTDGTATAAPVDSVDVAQSEGLLATISALAGGAPSANADRVAQLQKAVADGTYQMNPDAIAQNIAEIEQLLAKGTGSDC